MSGPTKRTDPTPPPSAPKRSALPSPGSSPPPQSRSSPNLRPRLTQLRPRAPPGETPLGSVRFARAVRTCLENRRSAARLAACDCRKEKEDKGSGGQNRRTNVTPEDNRWPCAAPCAAFVLIATESPTYRRTAPNERYYPPQRKTGQRHRAQQGSSRKRRPKFVRQRSTVRDAGNRADSSAEVSSAFPCFPFWCLRRSRPQAALHEAVC